MATKVKAAPGEPVDILQKRRRGIAMKKRPF